MEKIKNFLNELNDEYGDAYIPDYDKEALEGMIQEYALERFNQGYDLGYEKAEQDAE